ncbi:MAG: hypothetical protein EBX41_00070 [Chitinophagia bacterium]|nr:hypothetical protein [Chitinophagia bacterium]
MAKKRNKIYSRFSVLLFWVMGLVAGSSVSFKVMAIPVAPPPDTANSIIINIVHANSIAFFKTDSGSYYSFNGDVVLQQGTDTLYADSAYQNNATKNFEAFGNVRIAQAGGTQGKCNYLKYTAAEKTALMQHNVSLTDGKNNLTCQTLNYQLSTKIGSYSGGGTLHNDSTDVVSKEGVYNVNTKDAHFMGNVYINDPQYKAWSEDLGYNTGTRTTYFYAPSTVSSDSGRAILKASKGSYNPQDGLAGFSGHSSIWDNGSYIEADTLYYNKKTGYGYAQGKVIAMDTSQNAVLYCGTATYNRRQRTMRATQKPVLLKIAEGDSLYIRADTFYAYPQMLPKLAKKDSVPAIPKPKIKQKNKTPKPESTIIVKDTLPDADTTAPMLYCGYRNVKLFADSMQGVADSLQFSEADSTIRLFNNPIAWARSSQITGDTIILYTAGKQLKKITVPSNAFIASEAAPSKAQLYNQVQGSKMEATLKNDALEQLYVYPDAEAIYYTKDDNGAYLGVSQAKCEQMTIIFKEQAIEKIKLEHDVNQTLTPLTKIKLSQARLSRFIWQPNRRPLSKYELFK